MKRIAFVLLAGLAASATPAAAQSGFALKGQYILNSTTADEARESRTLPAADALGLGIEYVLPGGIGVGVSGYTVEDARDLDYRTSELTVIAEANYFLSFPLIPVAPYAGIHAGLGRLSREDLQGTDLVLSDRNRSQIGYQLGARLQLTELIGIDAQWRRMSTSAAEGQDGRLERNQVLLGVTLF